MKNSLSVLAFIFISSILLSRSAFGQNEKTASSTFVITNVTIVNVEKGLLEKNCFVIVAGDKIQEISTQSNANEPKNSRIVDGNGLFLISKG